MKITMTFDLMTLLPRMVKFTKLNVTNCDIGFHLYSFDFQILLKKRNICYYHRFKYIAMKVYVASIRVQENINNNCTLFKYSSYIHMYIYIYIHITFLCFLSDSIDHLYASWKHVEIVCWNISCSYAALIEVYDWFV